jgi:pimeloyl-ACP methyl ester carboxylesterase
MTNYLLIHGAGSDSWYWHLVAPRLEAAGHAVIAVDLPCDDDRAGWTEYADAAVSAVEQAGAAEDLIVVAQSLGGFVAPLVATRVPVRLIVLVAAMVPAPGETGGDWWTNTGQVEAQAEQAHRDGRVPGTDDVVDLFLHDVPDDVAAASADHVKAQSGTPWGEPWPLAAWPDVPTRFLLCRDDRIFPAKFQRRVVRARLGIEPEEMDGGHLPALARPAELVDRLERYRREAGI